MELELKFDLQSELNMRNGLVKQFTTLEDLKEKFFKFFKEQEINRGYGLYSFKKPVDKDYKILKNDNIALVGDEEEFSFEMFLEEVEDDEEGNHQSEVGYSSHNPFLKALERLEYDIETPKQEEVRSIARKTLNRGYSGLDFKVDPVEEPDKELKNCGTDEDCHKVSRPIEEIIPQKSQKIYVNLVDFIKDNPNCSVKEASKFFSSKEIQKQIKMGKVYLRKGRLSV